VSAGPLSVLVSRLPADPALLPTTRAVEACREIYATRDQIVGSIDVADALEALRRSGAIEKYVKTKEHKDEARRAQRVLETAVGAALGPLPEHGPGRGKKNIDPDQCLLTRDLANRFRLMNQYREAWWPDLNESALTRARALQIIDQCRNQSTYEVSREFVTVEDLESLSGANFRTVWADPPWQYGNKGTRGNTAEHYKAGQLDMTVDEICALPIEAAVAENAHLHLWTTNGFLFEAQRVIEAWGFEYKSCYVWVKPQIGMGNYWRVSHEFLLLGVRGSLPFADRSLRSWGEFKRRQHSAKPEEIRDLIHRASPVPRLELFARRPVEGWTCWGNEIERNVFHNSKVSNG
jgi:N6-adenosine-specific RNA methylase IME4